MKKRKETCSNQQEEKRKKQHTHSPSSSIQSCKSSTSQTIYASPCRRRLPPNLLRRKIPPTTSPTTIPARIPTTPTTGIQPSSRLPRLLIPPPIIPMHLNLRPLLIQRHQPALSITPPPDMRPARGAARPAPHPNRRVPALCLCLSLPVLLLWCIPIVLLSRLVRPRRRQLDHPAGRLQLGCAGDKRAVHVSIGILAAVGGELAGVALVAPVVVGVAATLLLLLGVAVGGATADAGRLHGLLLLVVDVVEVGWVGGVWAGVAGAGVGEVEDVVVCRG